MFCCCCCGWLEDDTTLRLLFRSKEAEFSTLDCDDCGVDPLYELRQPTAEASEKKNNW